MPSLLEKIETARSHVIGLGGVPPEIGIILGTGLGSMAEFLQVETEIPYSEIVTTQGI